MSTIMGEMDISDDWSDSEEKEKEKELAAMKIKDFSRGKSKMVIFQKGGVPQEFRRFKQSPLQLTVTYMFELDDDMNHSDVYDLIFLQSFYEPDNFMFHFKGSSGITTFTKFSQHLIPEFNKWDLLSTYINNECSFPVNETFILDFVVITKE